MTCIARRVSHGVCLTSCIARRVSDGARLAAVQVQQSLPTEELYGMPIPESMKDDALRPDDADAAKDSSAPRGTMADDAVRKKAHGTFQEVRAPGHGHGQCARTAPCTWAAGRPPGWLPGRPRPRKMLHSWGTPRRCAWLHVPCLVPLCRVCTMHAVLTLMLRALRVHAGA